VRWLQGTDVPEEKYGPAGLPGRRMNRRRQEDLLEIDRVRAAVRAPAC
jgi:hypothetical protein